MYVKDMRDLLDGEILFGEHLLNRSVNTAFSSDMMSDVLAYAEDQSVLITSLCNAQVIRTAEMVDIVCIVFVRSKQPDDHMLELARERDIVVLGTAHKMFTTCGILYGAGLTGGGE